MSVPYNHKPAHSPSSRIGLNILFAIIVVIALGVMAFDTSILSFF